MQRVGAPAAAAATAAACSITRGVLDCPVRHCVAAPPLLARRCWPPTHPTPAAVAAATRATRRLGHESL